MEFVIRTMKPITNVDKSILETALEVIDETVDDGTKNIYCGFKPELLALST